MKMSVIAAGGLKGYCSLKMGEGQLSWISCDVTCTNDVTPDIDIVNYSTLTHLNKSADNQGQ